jgi:hypothetical protein
VGFGQKGRVHLEAAESGMGLVCWVDLGVYRFASFHAQVKEDE